MKDCKFNPPTNGTKGFHYVIENGRPRLLTRKDLKDVPKGAISFKLPSEEGSRKLRMKAQTELGEGIASGVLPMTWELQPSRMRAHYQGVLLATEFGDSPLPLGFSVLDSFDSSGFNMITNTRFDANGFDAAGFNKDGLNRRGFNRNGRDRYGKRYDAEGFDANGYNESGYDKHGFDREGVHRIDGSLRSENPVYLKELQRQTRYCLLDSAGRDTRGFDASGVNAPVSERWPGESRGFGKHGSFGSDEPASEQSPSATYDENGFDAYGIHRESRNWLVKRTSPDGSDVWVDAWGRTWMSDARPRDNRGFDLQGALANGSRVDSQGFNAFGIHEVTRTFADERGLSREGIHLASDGNDGFGFDENGFSSSGTHRTTGVSIDPDGYNAGGWDRLGFNRDGTHRDTGTKFDKAGLDRYGRSRKEQLKEDREQRRLDSDRHSDDAFDADAFDANGFDDEVRHRAPANRPGDPVPHNSPGHDWFGPTT